MTRDLSEALLSITYTDEVTGKSDDVELKVQNRDGRWWHAWHPVRGDHLSVLMGYEGEALLDCGEFEVDQVEQSGPPDVTTIKALATGRRTGMWTRRSGAYEGATLRQVAEGVATRNGLRIVGSPGALESLRVGRLTQSDESDLAFLKRVGERFGFVFSVRAGQLTLYERAELEARPSVFRVRRADAIRYAFTEKLKDVYAACDVHYDDPVSGKVIRSRAIEARVVAARADLVAIVDAEQSGQFAELVRQQPERARAELAALRQLAADLGLARAVSAEDETEELARLAFEISRSVDVLKLEHRVENTQQADAVAAAALRAANAREVTGRVTVQGTPLLVAGNNVAVADYGVYDGVYHITTSRHQLSKDAGYTTETEVSLLRAVEIAVRYGADTAPSATVLGG